MSNLLINEPPLMVLPSLAVRIGMNEALILQQIHYWLNPKINKNFKEGKYWVYNTYKQWKELFPFFSDKTIRRTIYNLEEKNLILSSEFNTKQGDRTKWYTVNYEEICALDLSGQNDHMHLVKTTNSSGQNDQSLYKDTKITTEITSPLTPQRGEKKKEDKSLKEENTSLRLPFKPAIFSSIQTMAEIWHSIVQERQGPLPQVKEKRQQALLHAFRSYFGSEMTQWEDFCRTIASSKFLMGETKEKFAIKLDWALKPETIEKILDASFTIGDRLLEDQLVTGEENAWEKAQSLYEELSVEELDVYKQLYLEEKRKKDPHFSLATEPESRFKHFVVSILKTQQ